MGGEQNWGQTEIGNERANSAIPCFVTQEHISKDKYSQQTVLPRLLPDSSEHKV